MTAPEQASLRILVVDDDEGRIEIVNTLRRERFVVDDADGIAGAKQRLSEQIYDVVLLDMRMPNGEDDPAEAGLVVLRDIAAREQPQPAVIILTAHGSPPNTLAALELGAVAYLDKFQHQTSLAARVREVCQRRRAAIPDDSLAFQIMQARQLQRTLLPGPQELGGLSVAGGNIAALYLSGDAYDFISDANGHKLYLFLCDPMGKSLPAAYVSPHLVRTFRTGARSGWSLQDLDAALHEAADEAGGGERYTTGVLGLVDLAGHHLELLLAGHPAPSFCGFFPSPDGNDRGPAWGAIPNRGAPSILRLPFGPGQSVLSFTDGVTDVGRDESNCFGAHRIQAAHNAFTGNSANQLCDPILYEALVHGRLLAACTDDMTVLGLHWRGEFV